MVPGCCVFLICWRVQSQTLKCHVCIPGFSIREYFVEKLKFCWVFLSLPLAYERPQQTFRYEHRLFHRLHRVGRVLLLYSTQTNFMRWQVLSSSIRLHPCVFKHMDISCFYHAESLSSNIFQLASSSLADGAKCRECSPLRPIPCLFKASRQVLIHKISYCRPPLSLAEIIEFADQLMITRCVHRDPFARIIPFD